ncbi:acetyl-CoA acetyltransferase [Desulfosporosinus orientis DSM 765]|uniref:Acetyl-CoA acetyltransferase n=1 Tax=Desulfosporosinus orientis (strain ATCC 19365 / DSM 765 / NCIMB 8382 / VKM B-1628 / Singapore I) TaxID=768706 RepID=G7WGT1_DESOD|nr:thiolase family protein [Desulfosporosinus orientis]AET68517.1 acetyl-CoA acetyltransferase [Desulfosporosinus orientis DSM 765]
MEDIAIIGIGLHPFGRFKGKSALEMGVDAVNDALKDAGVAWKDLQVAYGGSGHGGYADSLNSKFGFTGLPFYNVFNGCATAASALIGAATALKSGAADLALAVGFDKHPVGSFEMDPEEWGLKKWYAENGFMITTQYFAMKIQRYMHDYGITNDSLVRVAMKNYYNASLNPKAYRRTALDYDTIANSTMLSDPLRQYMFCSPDEGAAAAILCRASDAKKYTTRPIYVKAYGLKSRTYESFEVVSPYKAIKNVPTVVEVTAQAAYKMAGIGPDEIQIAQVQDTEAGHEIMHIAELGLCKHGDQEKLIRDGETQINGRIPVNTDGGLIGNGEPVGASALRQIYEVCLQMRGEAGAHQVPNPPKTAITQVYGMPGVSAVTILQR